MEARYIIAKRAAQELKDGDYVNLGIGIPTLLVNYLPENVHVVLHSENGILGSGPTPSPENADKDLTNAGGKPSSIVAGGSFFDNAMSFGIIRGKHLDMAVLGALQVDAQGNLANWIVPNEKVPGIGGAMDLVVGARKVIVAMEHTSKGTPKILDKCTLPLTAVKVVSLIITEMAVFAVEPDGLVLKEIAPNVHLNDIKKVTPAKYIVDNGLKVMNV